MNQSLIERLRVLIKSSMGDDLFTLINDGLIRHAQTLMSADSTNDLYRAQGATQALSDLIRFLTDLKNTERAPENGDNPDGDNPPIQE
jgi:hypothetical protein